MKNAIQVLAVLMVSMFVHAQDKRTPGHFTGVDIRGSFDVVLVKGKEGVTIDADKSSSENIKTEVENGILNIYVEKGGKIKGDVNIEVSYESISLVALNGSGDVATNGKIATENLKVQLIGSGDMSLEIEAENVKASLDGSGDMLLKGKTSNFKVDLTGSGDMSANELKAVNVSVDVTGSGDATVYASEAIKAKVQGSGDIAYSGNPPLEDTKVSGSGSIDKR